METKQFPLKRYSSKVATTLAVCSALYCSGSLAHGDIPLVLNNHSCPGVLYDVGRYNQNSRPGMPPAHISPANWADQCPARDNCGQFDNALFFSETFCAIQTHALISNKINASFQTYYHGPGNFVQPQNQHLYTVDQGIDFSCRVCAPNERMVMEAQKHKYSDLFTPDDDVFLHWWRLPPYGQQASYQSAKLYLQRKPLTSDITFSEKFTIGTIEPFSKVNLRQHAELIPCHQYRVTVEVTDKKDNSYNSQTEFTLIDKAQCPVAD